MRTLEVTDDAPLQRVLNGPTLLDALHAGAQVRAAAARLGAEQLLEGFAAADPLARLLLLSPLARTGHPEADHVLCSALVGPDPAEREHAAWALGDRGPLAEAGAGLHALRSQGGFGAMLAELTLDRWSEASTPSFDPSPPRRSGLRIVQVYMPGYLDAGLQRAGAGDGGGLATLLVHLSAALGAHPAVAQVTTLTRAFAGPGVPAAYGTERERVSERAAIERIRFGGDEYLAAPDLWPHRRELEHALEAALTRLAPIDAVHLRFADVATLAAERVCRRLGLPVYFTLAPDPHGVIHSREANGELDRPSFVEADAAEHLIFRARLVEHMRDRSHGLALLPRARGRAELQTLVRLPADTPGQRVRTVPEGISIAPVDRAGGAPAVQDLVDRIRLLPHVRHGRPLILSVGRLNHVKGFPTLIDAWAGDPELREAYNLVIVGGDHEHPTRQEQLVLGELALAAGRHPDAAGGLLLIGHRAHRDVLALMAAARAGVPGVIGAAGVYACASRKEEFGLALLEAMASGLSVLGPDSGGPPTYIDDGITGILADTGTVSGLREGLHRAGAGRTDPERAALATAKVREHFTIEAMARGLVELYAP